MRVLCVGGDIALRIHGEMLDYWQIQTEILARKFEVTDSGITLATTMFVFLQFRKLGPNLWQNLPFLPWALLFSITNSFSEEVIYRLGVVVPLAGAVNQDYILLLSATAFGLPHLRGMPSGIVGAFMAGLLGWLLAKSLLKTNGIFWAWFIHFLQDIIIFTGFVMTAAPRKPR